MKTRMLMVFIALLAIVPIQTVCAQDVEGVDIHQKMTKSQIVEKFGQPTSYKTYEADDGTPEEIYHFDKNRINFSNGYLSEFSINDDSFLVLTKSVTGGVKVGDPLSKVSSLNPEVATWRSSKNNIYYISILDTNVFFVVSDGKITNINFSLPV